MFRAKSTEIETKNEWLYGFYREFKVNNTTAYYSDTVNNNRSFFIDTNTVGQYPRIEDKNGVKIFEGDIFKDSHGMIFTVECDNDGSRFLGFRKNDGSLYHIDGNRYISYIGKEPRKVGNIYETIRK